MVTELDFDDKQCHEIISQEWDIEDWLIITGKVLMRLGPSATLLCMKTAEPMMDGNLEYLLGGALRYAYGRARRN